MNEFSQGVIGSLGILGSLIYSVLCWFGGRDKDYLGIKARAWGRYIAPAIFVSYTIGLSLLSHRFSFWFLTAYPAYFLAHHLGYGGDVLWVKVTRRSLWSVVRTAASLTFVIIAGAWTLFFLQLSVGLIVTLVLGTMNPLKAPVEEGLNNFFGVVFVPPMVI